MIAQVDENSFCSQGSKPSLDLPNDNGTLENKTSNYEHINPQTSQRPTNMTNNRAIFIEMQPKILRRNEETGGRFFEQANNGK